MLLLADAVEPLILDRGLVLGRTDFDAFDPMAFTDTESFHHVVPFLEDGIGNLDAVHDRRSDIEVCADEVFPIELVVPENIRIQVGPVLDAQEEAVDALADEVSHRDETLAAASGIDSNGQEHVDTHVLLDPADAVRDQIDPGDVDSVLGCPFRNQCLQLRPLFRGVLDHSSFSFHLVEVVEYVVKEDNGVFLFFLVD